MNFPTQPRDYCYNNRLKAEQSANVKRFFKAALQKLPSNLTPNIAHNKGGIAVWGETTLRLYQEMSPMGLQPVLEAYDTDMGCLVRQWNGKRSGHNHYVETLDEFVALAKRLIQEPFQAF